MTKPTLPQFICYILITGLSLIILIDHSSSYSSENSTGQHPDCRYTLDSFDFHYKPDPGLKSIVMIGNSITRWPDWNKLLGRNDVINRGISGESLRCMCNRMKYLKGLNAKIWFIQGGFQGMPQSSPEELFEHYKCVVEFVLAENSVPVITSVIPISPKVKEYWPYLKDYEKMNGLIHKINLLLKKYAASHNLEYLDLSAILSDTNYSLRNEYTTDGVHLSEPTYLLWKEELNKLITKHLSVHKK